METSTVIMIIMTVIDIVNDFKEHQTYI